MIAKAVPSIWTSLEVLATLFLLLAASAATFWLLVRRWESHRQWLALAEWGRENGFRSQVCEPDRLPSPLQAISAREPAVRLCMAGESSTLVQMQTGAVQQSHAIPDVTGKVIWNLLIRHLPTAWHPTGLRPSSSRGSILDLYPLTSFPMLGTTERFTVFGTDSAAARALSDSMTRSLLPPDVGVLLYGNELMLDFSDRPFDEIEFNRMVSLANQIAQKLPVPT
jgi:hypothetical protein